MMTYHPCFHFSRFLYSSLYRTVARFLIAALVVVDIPTNVVAAPR